MVPWEIEAIVRTSVSLLGEGAKKYPAQLGKWIESSTPEIRLSITNWNATTIS
jgi:hypothetical protein